MAHLALTRSTWKALASSRLLVKHLRYASFAASQFRRARLSTSTNTVNPPQQKSWLLRWLSDETDETKVMDSTERQEREDLLERVRSMYFATPPLKPDLAFFKEAFQLLIKYCDRSGVETLWRLFTESGIDPDDEIQNMVDSFLADTEKSKWFD
ncbi:uncharacterized protein [Oscarella lobularis]|uniref:uncharacterized protein n=1 Tax=Oscarella lobularis TaxID=121494 RepID=UPI0033135CCF